VAGAHHDKRSLVQTPLHPLPVHEGRFSPGTVVYCAGPHCNGANKAALRLARLGLPVYDDGDGVPQDYAEALKWYRKAADQGNASAQFNLGKMYDNGQGVPQDYVQAHLWLNLAASQFSASEKEKRDHAIKYRNLVTSKMTPAQIGEAQKLAREWKPKPER
jgi:TPR repeat protein